ncbi:TadE/TadG family type IV pilus assembly protein [Streptomyces sp. NPDC059909]|uniref:TadE/TadG family type IV pilus assembly protein n=1 Tax=Streptomyces sp. NPDC059909 TaxID=3346998 RepID=UPI0036511410
MVSMGERFTRSVRSTTGLTRGRDRDQGQTAIEFVGVTPLIILLLIGLWQCALIGYTFSLASNSADVAARTGATSESVRWRAECREAAKEDLPDAWAKDVTTDCDPDDGLIRARVELEVPVLVPGVLNFPYTVEGKASAVRES